MKINIQEYLKREEEQKKKEDIEKAECDAFDGEYWYYNPHEDAGDRT